MKKIADVMRRFLVSNPVVILAIGLTILGVFFVPGFGTVRNLLNVADQRAYIAIMTVGLTFVLICGGMDLSLANNACLTGMISALLIVRMGLNGGLGITIALALGILMGMVNGFFIARVGVDSFIMTLITELFYSGIALVLSNSTSVTGLPKGYLAIAATKLFGIPASIFIMALFFIAGFVLLQLSTFGRKLYAVGTSPHTANLSGISVTQIKFLVFTISGFCASCAGILATSRTAGALPSAGTSVMLDVIAGAVIGGCSLLGGKGNIFGSLMGVYILSIISNAIDLLGLSFNIMLFIKGMVIVFALLTAYLNERIDEKRMLAKT